MFQVLDELEKETGDAESTLRDQEMRMNVMHIGAASYTGEFTVFRPHAVQ
jgi:hypothetical protein